MTVLYVDADACPVKDEVYRVAERYRVSVVLVSNTWMRKPANSWIDLVVVEEGPDIADDWIAAHATAWDIVVTADIPLAQRVLTAGAQALRPDGRRFTPESIGGALASRAVGEHLRSMGEITRGPRPFTPADRSRFLQALDAAIVKVRRSAGAQAPPAPGGSPGSAK